MKIFLSAIDKYTLNELNKKGVEMKWNLLSFFQFRNNYPLFEDVLRQSQEMLIDSGAHSFQKGKKVDWMTYTQQYADFISKYDTPKIKGYFEMDVDNIIGYDNVLRLRNVLTSVSDKIIPVWHKNRGISDFKKMCQEYAGRIVAITGFRNEDIRDEQYKIFLKEAKKSGCKVHCLGMTRKEILDIVPFDYTDSASWRLKTRYGRVDIHGKTFKIKKGIDTKTGYAKIWALEYINGMKMQEHYHNKWKWFSKD